jgi:peptidoglycan L-alanyl-D-glutamate endopeptidase CwlK
MHSKHLLQVDGCGHAVDLLPYVNGRAIDWNDISKMIWFAGRFFQSCESLGVSLRWGGNWDGDAEIITDQRFNDLVHWELRS